MYKNADEDIINLTEIEFSQSFKDDALCSKNNKSEEVFAVAN